jgi:hypothetical protein
VKGAEWAPGDERSTLVVLIHGEFRADLADASITLARQADYIVWGPGTGHLAQVRADSATRR